MAPPAPEHCLILGQAHCRAQAWKCCGQLRLSAFKTNPLAEQAINVARYDKTRLFVYKNSGGFRGTIRIRVRG